VSEFCVIFDLDGTLVDSEVLCNQAFVDLLPELGETAAFLTTEHRGKKLSSILQGLEHRLGRQLTADFESLYRVRVAELFDLHLEPTPGARKMLEGLSQLCCVASSGPPQKIAYALKIAGLATFFADRIFSSYDVGSWKPDPGLFLHAAGALGFPPNRCVVVEDSEVGLAAAKSAGMHALHYAPANAPRSGAPFESFSHMSELLPLIDAIVVTAHGR